MAEFVTDTMLGNFDVADGSSQPNWGLQETQLADLLHGVKRFARTVRGHWGIENSCPWSLDLTYRENEPRIRDRPVRGNFAWLNRFTHTLLKQHPGPESLIIKRRGCGWNDNFLTQVLTRTTSE